MALPRSFGIAARITPTRQQPAGVAIPEGSIDEENTSGAGNWISGALNLLDGDLTTFATLGTKATTGEGAEIIVDLGTWYRLKSLFAVAFGPNESGVDRTWSLYVSPDKRKWTQVGSGIPVNNDTYHSVNDNNSGSGWDNIRFLRIEHIANLNASGSIRVFMTFASAV